ncbi:MAG TPA: hypothetical protein VGC63_07695 [Solirubrobacterales bacterium]
MRRIVAALEWPGYREFRRHLGAARRLGGDAELLGQLACDEEPAAAVGEGVVWQAWPQLEAGAEVVDLDQRLACGPVEVHPGRPGRVPHGIGDQLAEGHLGAADVRAFLGMPLQVVAELMAKGRQSATVVCVEVPVHRSPIPSVEVRVWRSTPGALPLLLRRLA